MYIHFLPDRRFMSSFHSGTSRNFPANMVKVLHLARQWHVYLYKAKTVQRFTPVGLHSFDAPTSKIYRIPENNC